MLRRASVIALQARGYASLALHEQSSRTIEPITRSFQHSSRTSVSQATADKDSIEPTFDVISADVGSALMIKMPPDTVITAATGTAVGTSTRVSSMFSLDTTAVRAVGRRLLGDPMFYQKFYTKRAPGNVLLAPSGLGEIVVVELRGNAKYSVRRDCFLAKTEKVTLDLDTSHDSGLLRKLVHTAAGPGTLAIASHYGRLFHLSLAAGEEYHVNPRHLMLWDRRLEPTRLQSPFSVVPSPRSPWRRFVVVRNIVDSPSMQPRLQHLSALARRFRSLMFGTPEFVKLTGPGEAYLSSRVEPAYEYFRRISAVAAVQSSTTQMFESSDMFPASQADSEDPLDRVSAKSSHRQPGYATSKSVNGRPSYYAQVGPGGKITFVPPSLHDK